MLNFYDKFALSQSNATISVAYNRHCNLLLIASFMKQGAELSISCEMMHKAKGGSGLMGNGWRERLALTFDLELVCQACQSSIINLSTIVMLFLAHSLCPHFYALSWLGMFTPTDHIHTDRSNSNTTFYKVVALCCTTSKSLLYVNVWLRFFSIVGCWEPVGHSYRIFLFQWLEIFKSLFKFTFFCAFNKKTKKQITL